METLSLIIEHTQLSFHIVQTTNLLRKSTLERIGVGVKLVTDVTDISRVRFVHVNQDIREPTHISELNLTEFSQSTDNFSSDLVGDVELG